MEFKQQIRLRVNELLSEKDKLTVEYDKALFHDRNMVVADKMLSRINMLNESIIINMRALMETDDSGLLKRTTKDEDFLTYLSETKKKFISKVAPKLPDNESRVATEDLIIAYDQMFWEIKK